MVHLDLTKPTSRALRAESVRPETRCDGIGLRLAAEKRVHPRDLTDTKTRDSLILGGGGFGFRAGLDRAAGLAAWCDQVK